MEKKNESGSVENEGEQEIRTRAAEQAEKWLVNLRGDLEEKKREREKREKNTKEEDWRTGRDWMW